MSRREQHSAPADPGLVDPQPAPLSARRPRALDVAAAVLLVAACAAPAVGALLRPGAAAESVRAEQRTPAPWPSMPRSSREAARMPRLVKSWHDDHLGLRDLVLEARSHLLLGLLGVCPTSSAVIGDDDWLWYAGEGSMDAWRGANPARPAHIEAWTRVFRDRAAWCKARGIAYCAALAPNKMEIYPERVPPPYVPIGPSRYDQITAALKAEPGGWYLDLRDELRDERRHDVVDDYTYSRRGTHWSTRAALRGGIALISMARAAGVAVEVPRRSDFEFVPLPFDDDAWRGQLHLPDMEMEVQPVLGRNLARRWRPTERLDGLPKRVETLTGVDELPRMWVVHDSFGAALRPMLAPYFSRITYDWKTLGDFDPPAMIEFAPHVVLDLHTERQIFRNPPDLIASRDQAECAARFERAGAPVWTLAGSESRAVADEHMTCATDGSGLVLRALRPGAGVAFLDADANVAGTAILRLEFEAEHDAPIEVQWHVQGRDGRRPAPAVRHWITGGPQVLCVEILDPEARGPIRVCPGVAAGTVRLRAAEIRSASW